VLVGMDRDDGTLKLIEDGKMIAAVAQQSALMAYYGVKMLYYLNHGRFLLLRMIRLPDYSSAGYIDTGTVIINKDSDGTAAKVRVQIESRDSSEIWSPSAFPRT